MDDIKERLLRDEVITMPGQAFTLANAGPWLRANDALRNEAAARIEELEEQVSDLLSDVPCACGYDNPTDVCLKHYPLFRKLKDRIAELEAVNERLREAALQARYAARNRDWKKADSILSDIIARAAVKGETPTPPAPPA